MISWDDRLRIFRGVTKGIHQMHLAKIVHRDNKSENVLLLSGPRATEIAKIADLGRSRDMTAPSRFLPAAYVTGRGDLRFAPPEFLWHLGNDEGRDWILADLYLLGSLLFELVTGVGITPQVFGGDSWAELIKARGVPISERAQAYTARIPDLRRNYEYAYSVFAASVPPVIRDHALSLLRQLTDPDPSMRLRRNRSSQNLPMWYDLRWLLDRIDVIILTLRNASR